MYWVPTVMRAELWRKLRLDNKIVSLFTNVDMPSDTYDIPTESTDPTVYKVAEQTAGTPTLSTGITTSQEDSWTLTLARQGAAFGYGAYTVTFTEDGFDPVNSTIEALPDINPMGS